jgi:NAD-dependent dihydropyrimidine dehydrogenase PreA subunit
MVSIALEACGGCGVCTNVCPFGVLSIISKKAVAVNESVCIECGACEINCKDDAITVPKGTGCLLTIIKEDILKQKPETACCN